MINDDKGIDAIIANNKYLNSTMYGMEIIAKNYGDLYYSVKNECDLEIAKYAKSNDVMAIISNIIIWIFYYFNMDAGNFSHRVIFESHSPDSYEQLITIEI